MALPGGVVGDGPDARPGEGPDAGGEGGYDVLVCLDFEATCDNERPPLVWRGSSEIIEFAWAALDVATGEVVHAQQSPQVASRGLPDVAKRVLRPFCLVVFTCALCCLLPHVFVDCIPTGMPPLRGGFKRHVPCM